MCVCGIIASYSSKMFERYFSNLCKMCQIHKNITAKNTVISWCGNFVERHNFRIVSGFRQKLCGNCGFPQNIHTRKLREITLFFAVYVLKWKRDTWCQCSLKFEPIRTCFGNIIREIKKKNISHAYIHEHSSAANQGVLKNNSL